MTTTFATHKDELGREFSISGNFDWLEQSVRGWIGIEPDDEEYGINHIERSYESGERFTKEERMKDELEFQRILQFGYHEWYEVIQKMPKKKNGTFAKGRVLTLHRGETFQHYWEESYGYNAPEIRVKATGDLTAEVSLDEIVVGY